MKTLNAVFSSPSASRRYEVWFIRLALVGNGGAWWFRYLLMNPGKAGCPAALSGMPVQVWATWFPPDGPPETFIQGFQLGDLELSGRGRSPFLFCAGQNQVDENSCRGELTVRGHKISWDLHYRSTFQVTLSNKGWIGFSRTPHSDAEFSGHITVDGRRFEGAPLGYGLQGHNCGYRHRTFWNWTHAYFLRADGSASTLEALVYDLPLGLVFRKAVVWHQGQAQVFRSVQETRSSIEPFEWHFRCPEKHGLALEMKINGQDSGLHRLPYLKTDCSGTFDVFNNSAARASLNLYRGGRLLEKLETTNGAVLEMGGNRRGY